MRALVQRVTSAKVEVEGKTVGEIGGGLLVLLGIHREDGEAEAEFIAGKIAGLRIFDDGAGRMNLSVEETGGALLVVSQFTLYGDCRKGKRPGFDEAARPDVAISLYEKVVEKLRVRGIMVQTGVFQAHMHVSLVNDGPVTLLIETKSRTENRGPDERAEKSSQEK